MTKSAIKQWSWIRSHLSKSLFYCTSSCWSKLLMMVKLTYNSNVIMATLSLSLQHHSHTNPHKYCDNTTCTHERTDLQAEEWTAELVFACWDLMRLILPWYDRISCQTVASSQRTHRPPSLSSVTAASLSFPRPVLASLARCHIHFIATITICSGTKGAGSMELRRSMANFNSNSAGPVGTHRHTHIEIWCSLIP